MSYHSRRILTPGPNRKRKEREPSFYSSPLKPSAPAPTPVLAAAKAKPAQARQAAPKRSADEQAFSSNQLLAGYMAYEFLTKGTLFGQKFNPARAEAFPVGGVAEPKRSKQLDAAEPSGSEEEKKNNYNNKKNKKKKEAKEHESYAEVASILKSPEAHIPGIVNPTQLARWIQM